jgi:hypothetical protein
MQIDHDKNEAKKTGLPDFDRAWVHKKYGSDVHWTAMLPLVFISAAVYFYRTGWPF